MCELLRPTLFRRLQEYAELMDITNPQIIVTEGSKNGDSFSGEVYRVQVHPEGWDEQKDGKSEPRELLSNPQFNQLNRR